MSLKVARASTRDALGIMHTDLIHSQSAAHAVTIAPVLIKNPN